VRGRVGWRVGIRDFTWGWKIVTMVTLESPPPQGRILEWRQIARSPLSV